MKRKGCFLIRVFMVQPSPLILIGLLLISIGKIVTFDVKIDQFKVNIKRVKLDILGNIY